MLRHESVGVAEGAFGVLAALRGASGVWGEPPQGVWGEAERVRRAVGHAFQVLAETPSGEDPQALLKHDRRLDQARQLLSWEAFISRDAQTEVCFVLC